MAVNGWLSPFFPAGFYYKTFMWPPGFWEKVYEPAIRRAAGLGRARRAAILMNTKRPSLIATSLSSARVRPA